MRHARNGRLHVRRVAERVAPPVALLIGRLPLERQCERNDLVLVEGLALGDAAIVHDSRGPDEPRATGNHDAGHDHEHAAADGRGGLQRLQDDAGDHAGGRPGEPDHGGAGRSCADESADAGSEQPGLRAVARWLSEGRGFLPAGGQVLYARAGLVCAPRHCAAGSGAGGEQSHPGAGRFECGRAGNADPGHQES
jgi:hypothetical protein